jgi:nucleotide-binding universal stress UspA family protein
MGPVLIATDGSDDALAAARAAAELLHPGFEVVAVTTVAAPDLLDLEGTGFAGPAMTEQEQAAEQAAALIEADAETALTAHEIAGCRAVHQRVVEGEPGPALVALAVELGAAAIVVGSHGKGLFARLFAGSVSRYLIDHAPCPVLVVPHVGR